MAELVDPVESVLSGTGSRRGLLKDPDWSFLRGAGSGLQRSLKNRFLNTTKIFPKS